MKGQGGHKPLLALSHFLANFLFFATVFRYGLAPGEQFCSEEQQRLNKRDFSENKRKGEKSL